MAELTTLARPYAKAAFEYARDKQALADWSEQMATVARVSADPHIKAVLQDPAGAGERQADILADVCGDALGSDVKRFLSVLAQNRRLVLLPQISALFDDFRADHEKSVDVEVVSAFELEDEMTQNLVAALGKRLERKVNVRTTTDASLLGGVLIKAGDLVIDGSLRGRLNKLAAALNS
ncbi:F0F1 ATP synthase subunit delta [Kineobactrum sediminis]|uniref:ATP synthase subunit delta n=1 Tax=Kineobactrum sediminis TaxID=1905677 RepID=A0A2N5Y507_9GAMM|nr:F0F1 ATP synthase subunit delta [Kineobactrum sediminis]PLW83451.1 F0F1 ATP synthase subunit delta [Kineobactrum sediminis]